MEMCYDGALVMPNNYVDVTVEEMYDIDGGILSVPVIVAMIAGLAAAGVSVETIGEKCGEYCFNQGYARDGWAKDIIAVAGNVNTATAWAMPLFLIGYDNGWVKASKA